MVTEGTNWKYACGETEWQTGMDSDKVGYTQTLLFELYKPEALE